MAHQDDYLEAKAAIITLIQNGFNAANYLAEWAVNEAYRMSNNKDSYPLALRHKAYVGDEFRAVVGLITNEQFNDAAVLVEYFLGDMKSGLFLFVRGIDVRKHLDSRHEFALVTEQLEAAVFQLKRLGRGSFDEVYREPAIPQEMPAPIRVKITEGRITLDNAKRLNGVIDFDAADRVRAEVVLQLDDLILDFDSNSNVDKRFLKTIRNFQRSLSALMIDCSIESIGVNMQLIKRVLSFTRTELNELDAVRIEHIIETTSILLGQFEEWNNYLAASDKLDSNLVDGDALVQQADALALELNASSNVIDNEIVKRLRDMTGPVLNDIVQAHAVVPALLSSLNNLFASMSGIVVEYTAFALANATISTGLSAGVILAGVCIKILNKFAPRFKNVKSLGFLNSVVEFVTRHYSAIANFLH
ncbi:hypothetical protein [Methylobacterium sp. WCS2018Hpa-22]|uniref:hypothetical protein n=1 Tax=Methylobacterium sp. WCS2018Hpa-22 TaxID=3073633 RepID=UPI0028893429|nr:hypothetical protein [Methylobacterium sp. WCS2018Hpa-22]